MAHRAHYLHRLIGAREAKIAEGAKCHFCQQQATHRIWSATGGGVLCDVHAEQGRKLGYEVVKCEIKAKS